MDALVDEDVKPWRRSGNRMPSAAATSWQRLVAAVPMQWGRPMGAAARTVELEAALGLLRDDGHEHEQSHDDEVAYPPPQQLGITTIALQIRKKTAQQPLGSSADGLFVGGIGWRVLIDRVVGQMCCRPMLVNQPQMRIHAHTVDGEHSITHRIRFRCHRGCTWPRA
jgi:hypothetical protein